MATHYVNNTEFLQAIKDHKVKLAAAKEAGLPPPPLSNYIGECILKIATNFAYKPNFINYTYREEMVSDGVENCLMYFDNFDPAKSSNPFAYFTQIIYFAFLRRIQKEKKQTMIKGKIIMDMPFDAFDVQEQDEDGLYTSSYIDFMQNNSVFEDIVKEDKPKVSKKKAQPNLDDIFESDNE